MPSAPHITNTSENSGRAVLSGVYWPKAVVQAVTDQILAQMK